MGRKSEQTQESNPLLKLAQKLSGDIIGHPVFHDDVHRTVEELGYVVDQVNVHNGRF